MKSVALDLNVIISALSNEGCAKLLFFLAESNERDTDCGVRIAADDSVVRDQYNTYYEAKRRETSIPSLDLLFLQRVLPNWTNWTDKKDCDPDRLTNHSTRIGLCEDKLERTLLALAADPDVLIATVPQEAAHPGLCPRAIIQDPEQIQLLNDDGFKCDIMCADQALKALEEARADCLSPLLRVLGIDHAGKIIRRHRLAQSVRQALWTSETDMIEFKAGVPKDEVIAKELIAFRNTKGGVLVFGLPDDPTNPEEMAKAATGRAKLSDRKFWADALTRIDRVAKVVCTPPIMYAPHRLKATTYLDGALGYVLLLAVLPIQPGDALCSSKGLGYYVRLWGACEPAEPEWITDYYQNNGRKAWVECLE